METEKKSQKFILIILTAFLILSLSLLFWKIMSANSPDNPDDPTGLAAGVNIGVCINPPSPDLSDPSRPVFRWTTSGNNQKKYWLKVDDSGTDFSSPEIDTGEVNAGRDFHKVNPGELPQNKTYWYCVAVADSFGWTGWTGCDSFFLSDQPPSAKNLTTTPNYCTLTDNLSWTFDDPDYGDSQTAYQIQVDDNSDFSSPEVDTGKLDFSSSFYLLDLRRLSYNTTYNWRLKVWDKINPDVSDWINGPSFTTSEHQGPAVDFNWGPGLLMPDNTVRIEFFDRSTVYGGTAKSAWLWTFENGVPATSIQQNSSAGFSPAVNQSNVTLKVTDSGGYSCETTKIVNISGLRNQLKEITPQ